MTQSTKITEATVWAPLPATLTGAVSDAPPAIADDGKVQLGGHAPMFQPELVADAGLVRLGGHSPTF